MNTPLPHGEIRAILGENCFVRKAVEDDRLFVTDAPRRLAGALLITLSDALTAQGFRVWITERGLWAIDLSEQRWLALLDRFENSTMSALPEDSRLHDVYALVRLFRAHPAPWEIQPRGSVRAILKRFDQGEELVRYAPDLIKDCAKLLREHQPLPCAAAGILCMWLSEFAKEAEG